MPTPIVMTEYAMAVCLGTVSGDDVEE